MIWEDGYEILPSGGHIPTHMSKHIYFEEDGTCRKFIFPNEKPTQGWEEYEVDCSTKTNRNNIELILNKGDLICLSTFLVIIKWRYPHVYIINYGLSL